MTISIIFSKIYRCNDFSGNVISFISALIHIIQIYSLFQFKNAENIIKKIKTSFIYIQIIGKFYKFENKYAYFYHILFYFLEILFKLLYIFGFYFIQSCNTKIFYMKNCRINFLSNFN